MRVLEAYAAATDEQIFNEYNHQKHIEDEISEIQDQTLTAVFEKNNPLTRARALVFNYQALRGEIAKLESKFVQMQLSRGVLENQLNMYRDGYRTELMQRLQLEQLCRVLRNRLDNVPGKSVAAFDSLEDELCKLNATMDQVRMQKNESIEFAPPDGEQTKVNERDEQNAQDLVAAMMEPNNYGHLLQHQSAESLLVQLLSLRPQDPKQRAQRIKEVLRTFFEQYEQREHYFAHVVRQKDLEIEMHHSRANFAEESARTAIDKARSMTQVAANFMAQDDALRKRVQEYEIQIAMLANMLIKGPEAEVPTQLQPDSAKTGLYSLHANFEPGSEDPPQYSLPLTKVVQHYKNEKSKIPTALLKVINEVQDRERLAQAPPSIDTKAMEDIIGLDLESHLARQAVLWREYSLGSGEEFEADQRKWLDTLSRCFNNFTLSWVTIEKSVRDSFAGETSDNVHTMERILWTTEKQRELVQLLYLLLGQSLRTWNDVAVGLQDHFTARLSKTQEDIQSSLHFLRANFMGELQTLGEEVKVTTDTMPKLGENIHRVVEEINKLRETKEHLEKELARMQQLTRDQANKIDIMEKQLPTAQKQSRALQTTSRAIFALRDEITPLRHLQQTVILAIKEYQQLINEEQKRLGQPPKELTVPVEGSLMTLTQAVDEMLVDRLELQKTITQLDSDLKASQGKLQRLESLCRTLAKERKKHLETEPAKNQSAGNINDDANCKPHNGELPPKATSQARGPAGTLSQERNEILRNGATTSNGHNPSEQVGQTPSADTDVSSKMPSQEAAQSAQQMSQSSKSLCNSTAPEIALGEKSEVISSLRNYLETVGTRRTSSRLQQLPPLSLASSDILDQYESGYAAAEFFTKMLGFDPSGMPIEDVLRKFQSQQQQHCVDPDCQLHDPGQQGKSKAFNDFLNSISTDTGLLQGILQGTQRLEPRTTDSARLPGARGAPQSPASPRSLSQASHSRPVFGPERPPAGPAR
jgi:hypothetical protein